MLNGISYIAIPVAEGRCERRGIRHSTIRYPELKGKSLKLYIEAYGEEKYIKEFYMSPSVLNGRSALFQQLPVHGTESIIWIIIDHLLKAIPQGDNAEVTDLALRALRILAKHAIKDEDPQRVFKDFLERDWADRLHPRLSHLAPMLTKFSELLEIHWTLWCINGFLSQDILHEAIKRVLLEEIIHIKAGKCDIRLGSEVRKPLPDMPKTTGGLNKSNLKNAKQKSSSAYASSSKKSRIY